MANDFQQVVRPIFDAAHNVSNEPTGFIESSNTDMAATGAGLGDEIKVPRVGSATVANYVRAQNPVIGGDTAPSTSTLTISKERMATWYLTDEEERRLSNAGTFDDVMRQKAEEAMRGLRNELDFDLFVEAYQNASRAIGTAGTTPFGSDLKDAALMKKVFDDNGAPMSGRSLVLGTSAGANMRSVPNITLSNQNGSDATLRNGVLLDVDGFAIRESVQVGTHTKGDGTGYLVNGALAGGDRDVVVDTGSGSIVAGDIVTFAGDTNKYAVNTALSANQFSIGYPGLRGAVADNSAVTVGDDYTPNVALVRSALTAAVRPPIIKNSGVLQTELVGDDRTNLTFAFVRVIGDGLTTYRVHLNWGVKAIQPEHIAILMG